MEVQLKRTSDPAISITFKLELEHRQSALCKNIHPADV